jgi:hypothetical protein
MERAAEHLKALDEASTYWLKENTDAIRGERDPDTGDDLVVIDPREVPDRIGLIAADCIHNLRASLDQLVYALAWSHTAGPLTKSVAENSEFLVFGPRAPKASEIAKRIGAIHPDAQAIIEGLQPHLRGDSFASDELWILDQLWNADKHRTLPLTVFFAPGAIHLRPGRGRAELHGLTAYAGPIRRKTNLLRYKAGPNHEMDMKGAFDPEIALAEGTPAQGEAAVPLLTRLSDYVSAKIVAPLSGYLP